MKLSKHPKNLLLQAVLNMTFVMLTSSVLIAADVNCKDTTCILDLIRLSKEAHQKAATKEHLEYAERAYLISDSLDYSRGKALALLQKGIAHRELGNNSKAAEILKHSAELFATANDKSGESKAYLVLANCFDRNGEYENAMEYALRSLAYSEFCKDSINIANAHSTLGVLHFRRGDIDIAQKHYDNAVLILQKINKPVNAANVYNNIGALWSGKKNYKKALNYFQNAASINLEQKNYSELWTNFTNIGLCHEKLQQFNEAIEHHQKSITICRDAGLKQGLANSYLNLASSLFSAGRKNTSAYLDSALTIAKEINHHVMLRSVYLALSEVANANGDHLKAYQYYKLYSDEKDSTFSEEKDEKLQRLQTAFETEKKDRQIELLNKTRELKDSEIERQRMISYAAGAGLVIILGFSLVIGFAYSEKKKTNKKLLHASEVIAEKSKAVEEKNKDITDSITYAKNIQEAILPKPYLFSVFTDHFILYEPRDIVSGDLYFIHNSSSEIILAAADCTGHGVPGAFMSLIGNELLQKAMEKKIYDPSIILLELNSGIRAALKQKDESGPKDGMDIAVCVIDLESLQLRASAAHRPVYHVRDKVLTEIKPDKVTIGEKASEDITFTNTYYHLRKGDWIYLTSDGYADQFGGDKGKKFLSRNLRDLLQTISTKNGDSQELILKGQFNSWKGSREQVDDVMIIGVKI